MGYLFMITFLLFMMGCMASPKIGETKTSQHVTFHSNGLVERRLAVGMRCKTLVEFQEHIKRISEEGGWTVVTPPFMNGIPYKDGTADYATVLTRNY